ncbi:SPL family radical SAM protein [Occallatibacter riparius]|uniref:Radical SAM protein n=1 Tax=Occallatibacter riparius TaxID=1002689 RepID=A0A9J7BN49_9BACT|nr:radical SAM protein [Occallatibacter riparius]UWZ83186.1 radical SAM protein [Occallatibacter riparius]
MAKTESLFPTAEFPAEPVRRLNLLARAAASAPLDSAGHLTEYRPVQSRSIISKVQSNRGLPFTHAINPYRGCEFACRYCYARYAHEFMELTPEDFERKIFFKENAGWLVQQELAHLKSNTPIALGTATDPWQPIERRQRITRSILEAFAKTSGFGLGIVTKSTLILRDIELLRTISRHHDLTVHITVTTMDTALARALEPRAPRPDLRIWTLRRMREAGIRAGVLCCPVMPGITDSRRSLEAVAKAASEAGASFFAANPLFLQACSLPTFFKFVEEHFPGQLDAYRQRYGANAFVSAEYSKRIADLVNAICRQYKLGRRQEPKPPASEMQPPELVQIQTSLPFTA